ncbi:hypothetical protein [Granulicoccus phenolivorans]|uniref:hypothetical protein n=1 Tax=Granulicoccus phenolivorans TaxID=266854 RepID=UPI00047E9B2F|nr:hypothetical protein [Granulicoccus phenolivorans]
MQSVREPCCPTSTIPGPQSWVEAAPFRAKLRLLMAETDLPWQAVAVAAGVPLEPVRTLLFGRTGGRPLRRLYPPHARALFELEAADLHQVRRTLVPAEQLTLPVGRLLAAGVPEVEVRRQLRLTPDQVRRIRRREPVLVSALTLLLAEATRQDRAAGRQRDAGRHRDARGHRVLRPRAA